MIHVDRGEVRVYENDEMISMEVGASPWKTALIVCKHIKKFGDDIPVRIDMTWRHEATYVLKHLSFHKNLIKETWHREAVTLEMLDGSKKQIPLKEAQLLYDNTE
jgi:hypothetical protein